MPGFRLLRASGGFERHDLLAMFPEGRTTELDVEFAPLPVRNGHPWVSVIIGKNGVGKSRLLAGITDFFEMLDRGSSRRRKEELTVSTLAYSCRGHICEVRMSEDQKLHATLDGVECVPGDLPLPGKIIALTTTPFDKFRISRMVAQMPGRERDIPERYSYLGLRDRTNRASPTAAIFRALENLFEASRSSAFRRSRIAEIFKFLGYEPRMVVRYEFTPRARERLQYLIQEDLFQGANEDERFDRQNRAMSRLLESNPDLIHELREVGAEALDRAGYGGHFSLKADFREHSRDEDFFRSVQLLRKADLLRMRAVEIERLADGALLDLRLASSGELGIVTGFLGLASVIEDGSLIFIDEPEISLHPEWQARYIDLLIRTFEGFKGCHFVLATHSPLILSDISPDYSSVVSLDDKGKGPEDAEQFAGQSSDFLLATAFDAPGKNNIYLKQEIIKALRLAADGEVNSKTFERVMSPLTDLAPKLDEDSPIRQLIAELQALQTAGAAKDD